MSDARTHRVPVVKLTIKPHPNADRLELAQVGGFDVVVGKGQFQTGDFGAYIPEQSILPQPLIRQLGLEGRLAGKSADRVKAVRLRGVVSQGLVAPAQPSWREGDDVAQELGVTRWDPPIPVQLQGKAWVPGRGRCIGYDIENIKAYPDVFAPGEPVVVTEKIHGTWCQVGLVPEAYADPEEGRLVVSSKGQAQAHRAIKRTGEGAAQNLYVRAERGLGIGERIERAFPAEQLPIFVLGEIFGNGVQDLDYGATAQAGPDAIGFRVFDIFTGWYPGGRFLNDDELDAACEALGLPRVPVLWRGPFDRARIAELTSGSESVSGQSRHIREGVVVRSAVESRHDELGRKQLKSISDAYLFRSGGTEYN
jgi:RNA ligase (TIGR02306 family)